MQPHARMLAWTLPFMVLVGFACLLFPPLLIVVIVLLIASSRWHDAHYDTAKDPALKHTPFDPESVLYDPDFTYMTDDEQWRYDRPLWHRRHPGQDRPR